MQVQPNQNTLLKVREELLRLATLTSERRCSVWWAVSCATVERAAPGCFLSKGCAAGPGCVQAALPADPAHAVAHSVSKAHSDALQGLWQAQQEHSVVSSGFEQSHASFARIDHFCAHGENERGRWHLTNLVPCQNPLSCSPWPPSPSTDPTPPPGTCPPHSPPLSAMRVPSLHTSFLEATRCPWSAVAQQSQPFFW